jgi:hypothetical protein
MGNSKRFESAPWEREWEDARRLLGSLVSQFSQVGSDFDLGCWLDLHIHNCLDRQHWQTAPDESYCRLSFVRLGVSLVLSKRQEEKDRGRRGWHRGTTARPSSFSVLEVFHTCCFFVTRLILKTRVMPNNSAEVALKLESLRLSRFSLGQADFWLVVLGVLTQGNS